MHDSIAVQKIDSLANLTKQLANERLGQLMALNLLKKRAAVHVLQHHVGDVSLLLHVVVQQFDDVLVFQLLMHGDLLLGVFIVDLRWVNKLPF
jgi:hypothetical protein